MDLNFTPDELAFRADIRHWVAENLPKDISAKVLNALRLSRSDMQRWAQILGKKGWLGSTGRCSSAARDGPLCSATCSKRNVHWRARRGSSPSAR